MEYILVGIAVMLGFLCWDFRRLMLQQQNIYKYAQPKRELKIILPDTLSLADQYQQFKTQCLFIPAPPIDKHVSVLNDCRNYGGKLAEHAAEALKDILNFLRKYCEDVLNYITLEDQSVFDLESRQLKLNVVICCQTKFPKLGTFGICVQICNQKNQAIELFDPQKNLTCTEIMIAALPFANHTIEKYCIQRDIDIPIDKLATAMLDQTSKGKKNSKLLLTYHIKILDIIFHTRTLELPNKINVLSVIRETLTSTP